ncbi:hypothetical protein C8R43DRAFT_944867 [Mycena crocata]|nr:hypothetical protein C8R43DRAFT_944867 [Mycena crocata]
MDFASPEQNVFDTLEGYASSVEATPERPTHLAFQNAAPEVASDVFDSPNGKPTTPPTLASISDTSFLGEMSLGSDIFSDVLTGIGSFPYTEANFLPSARKHLQWLRRGLNTADDNEHDREDEQDELTKLLPDAPAHHPRLSQPSITCLPTRRSLHDNPDPEDANNSSDEEVGDGLEEQVGGRGRAQDRPVEECDSWLRKTVTPTKHDQGLIQRAATRCGGGTAPPPASSHQLPLVTPPPKPARSKPVMVPSDVAPAAIGKQPTAFPNSKWLDLSKLGKVAAGRPVIKLPGKPHPETAKASDVNNMPVPTPSSCPPRPPPEPGFQWARHKTPGEWSQRPIRTQKLSPPPSLPPSEASGVIPAPPGYQWGYSNSSKGWRQRPLPLMGPPPPPPPPQMPLPPPPPRAPMPPPPPPRTPTLPPPPPQTPTPPPPPTPPSTPVPPPPPPPQTTLPHTPPSSTPAPPPRMPLHIKDFEWEAADFPPPPGWDPSFAQPPGTADLNAQTEEDGSVPVVEDDDDELLREAAPVLTRGNAWKTATKSCSATGYSQHHVMRGFNHYSGLYQGSSLNSWNLYQSMCNTLEYRVGERQRLDPTFVWVEGTPESEWRPMSMPEQRQGFALFCEQLPNHKVILRQFDEVNAAEKVETMAGRQVNFLKQFEKLRTIMDNLQRTYRFESMFLACGSGANKDSGLGDFHFMAGVKEWANCMPMNLNDIIGVLKSCAYNSSTDHLLETVKRDVKENAGPQEASDVKLGKAPRRNFKGLPEEACKAAQSEGSLRQQAGYNKEQRGIIDRLSVVCLADTGVDVWKITNAGTNWTAIARWRRSRRHEALTRGRTRESQI